MSFPPHPADEVLSWLHNPDFAVLGHGWTPHGRDYFVIVQDCMGRDRGTHELTFTHCVRVEYETRVRDDVWPRSWSDELTDYARWEAAGEPAGYVWGTNWSLAYPGLVVVRDSVDAAAWAARVGHPLFEVTLETDRFFLRLIFHSIRSRKINDDTDPVSRVIVPMPPPGSGE
jgi:hypothetical protein